jgi:hypothetical protein
MCQGKISPVNEKVPPRGGKSPKWLGLRREDQSEELCKVPSSIGEWRGFKLGFEAILQPVLSGLTLSHSISSQISGMAAIVLYKA